MSNTPNPSIAAMRQFIEIQNAGGIARAARQLGLTQPALSRNIKRLEVAVGVPLLDRHTRGTDLTPAGQSFLKHATRVILELEHGLEDARKVAGLARDELRVGVGAVLAHAIIPKVLPAFEAEKPTHKIMARTLPFEAIEDALLKRSVDFCIHGLPDDRSGSLTTRPLHKARRAILCSPKHPLAQSVAPVSVAQLAGYSFVAFAPDRDQMRDLDRTFHEHLLNPPHIALETDLLSGALNALHGGQYLMYGSSLLATYADPGSLIALKTEPDVGRYQLGVSYRKDADLGSGSRRFIALVTSLMRQA